MGKDVHEVRRNADKEDPNPASKYRTVKMSSADWQAHTSRGARIGAYYAKKLQEELYERWYLNDDSTKA